MALITRGVWGSPSEAGTDRDSIERYADTLARVGINELYMHLKGGDGLLYWPSERFPQCRAEPFAGIDFPQLLLDACKSRGIRVHAWMIDYFEGKNRAAHQAHPDWPMLDPLGRTSSEEMLRGKPFGCLWMCPARRPGYTDQWLVPIYREFAERYAFDGIHHDYIRYPGDVAPDRTCFCDYCLENMPKFNGLVSEAIPDEPFFHELYDRPYIESHWEQSPRVLPSNWDKLDRNAKARFLLDGSFFNGGRQDLDYFLYTYRTHWITQFAREAAQEVRQVRPGMEISAAVFKNPIHSGRFIGQDWRQFSPWVDTAIPMDYRDHFPGTFEQYLILLREAIERQKVWSMDFRRLLIGVAVNFLFKEEANGPWPEHKLEQVLDVIESSGAEGVVMFCDGQLRSFGQFQVLERRFGKS